METVPVGRDKSPGWEEGVGEGVWGGGGECVEGRYVWGGKVCGGGVCGGEEVCEVECMKRECVRSGMCGE